MTTSKELEEAHYEAGYQDGLAGKAMFASFTGKFPNHRVQYREGYNDAVPERARRGVLAENKVDAASN